MAAPTEQPPHARSFGVLAFVVFAGVVAIYLWTRPTRIAGPAAATMLTDMLHDKGLRPSRVDCDEATPVTALGARVECTIVLPAQEIHFALSFAQDGSVRGSPIGARSLPAPGAP